MTFLFFLICVLYAQAQRQPKSNAASVLQAPSLRILPAAPAAAYGISDKTAGKDVLFCVLSASTRLLITA